MYQEESIQESICAIGLIHDLCPPTTSPALSPASGKGIYSFTYSFTKGFLFYTRISWKLDLM